MPITESPPPAIGTPPYIQATKTNAGVSVVQDDRVFSARAVEVDLSITWVTTGNTTLSYATKAIIAKGGVTR